MSEKNDALATLARHDAPAGEHQDARMALEKAVRPTAGDLIPADSLSGMITQARMDSAAAEHMRQAYSEATTMAKAKVIPFPTRTNSPRANGGMQSVRLNEFQLTIQGDYYERPGLIGFDGMRQMVEQTPILNAIILTRMRQVQQFCRRPPSSDRPGFAIVTADRDAKIGPQEKESIENLTKFFLNCGWEFNPRQRKRLKRDSLPQFMTKIIRDSLVMDSAPIETEYKRNRAMGIDGFYAVDGATIRLCTEDGYEGDDAIFALQVLDGRPRTAYSLDDLIYEPRNPRTEVSMAGYGIAETELLIRVVTGLLNAMTLNINGFSENAFPKGILNLVGEYSTEDLGAFKQHWNGMMRGVKNAWNMPVMNSKDPLGAAKFEKFGVDFDEMYFSKWMTFLTSIACAVYGIGPDEINFESFSTGGGGGIGGNDTEEKITNSKDKGFTPLMSYAESLMSDYICAEFGGKYLFRWTGLDNEDREKRHEMRKLVQTVDEARAQEGMDKLPTKAGWGEAPLNAVLIQVWQAAQAPAVDPNAPQPGQEPGVEQPDPEQPDEVDDTQPSGVDRNATDFRKAQPRIYRPEW